MLKLSSLTVLMTMMVGTLALADPAIEILRVTSDSKKSVGLLYRYELVTDGGKIDHMLYYNFEEETRKPKTDKYTPADLQKKDGVAIVVREGHEVVRMKAPNLNVEKGGMIILDYLNDGLTGTRKEERLQIAKNAKGDWELSKDGRVVKELFFRTNKRKLLGGKEVGVKAIEIRQ